MYLVVFVSVTSVTITEGFGNHSESLLLFMFHGTEFRDVFSSAEGFGTEFRDFLFRGTAGIPSEITICSVNSVFRGIIFLSEIPNPSTDCDVRSNVHCHVLSRSAARHSFCYKWGAAGWREFLCLTGGILWPHRRPPWSSWVHFCNLYPIDVSHLNFNSLCLL